MISRLPELLSQEQLLMGLSRAVMRVLQTDSLATARLHALAGRVIGIRITGFDTAIFAAVDDEGLLLARETLREPDVILSGRLADFAAFAQARQGSDAMPAGALKIQGDLATAQAVQRLLDELNLDWEALLAERVGEVAARQIGRGVRQGFAWLRGGAESLRADLPAWLQDESRLVPAAEEVETFTRDGMSLASDVDRLAARIARLHKRGAA
ncbi:MAG: hypothetical protein FJ164_14265 [Gammaproteobacteria bacterium]|nr:hypothetical protein [Gammaproteobacteria bacterium]